MRKKTRVRPNSAQQLLGETVEKCAAMARTTARPLHQLAAQAFNKYA
jgi:hypothetical protein